MGGRAVTLFAKLSSALRRRQLLVVSLDSSAGLASEVIQKCLRQTREPWPSRLCFSR